VVKLASAAANPLQNLFFIGVHDLGGPKRELLFSPALPWMGRGPPLRFSFRGFLPGPSA